MPPTTGSRIGEGTVALRRGDWEDARAAFSAALEAEPSGAAWEGLGWAAWWLSDEATTLRAREAAYRAHRAEGDDAAAEAMLPRVLLSVNAIASGLRTTG